MNGQYTCVCTRMYDDPVCMHDTLLSSLARSGHLPFRLVATPRSSCCCADSLGRELFPPASWRRPSSSCCCNVGPLVRQTTSSSCRYQFTLCRVSLYEAPCNSTLCVSWTTETCNDVIACVVLVFFHVGCGWGHEPLPARAGNSLST